MASTISYGFTERAGVSSKLITRKVIDSIITAGKINLVLNILSRSLDIFKLLVMNYYNMEGFSDL